MNTIVDILLILVPSVIVVSFLILIVKNYRIADSNEILVITGKISGNRSAKTIHGGATFVWPIFQRYEYLSLSPITIDVNLLQVLSKQNIKIDVPSSFTIAISTEESLMAAASERILGKSQDEISTMAKEIIFGQCRAIIASLTIEEINQDRDKFIISVRGSVESELKKLGLIVINVNVKDLNDDSGYLEALGQKAASEAINNAKVDVANNDRNGAIGESQAKKEERIAIAKANSDAIQGENISERETIDSNASLKVGLEEAKRKEVSAELVNAAQAKKDGYDAEKLAEDAKAIAEKSKLTASDIIPAEIAKEKVILEAQAKKEQELLAGQAEGEAETARLKGEAEGLESILLAKAKGFKAIIESAGSAEAAAQLMIIEQLPELTRIQVEAISNVKIDKITVWESGGSDGKGSTSNFLQNMMGFVPPMNEMLNNAGLSIPSWMATEHEKYPLSKDSEMKDLDSETLKESEIEVIPDEVTTDEVTISTKE